MVEWADYGVITWRKVERGEGRKRRRQLEEVLCWSQARGGGGGATRPPAVSRVCGLASGPDSGVQKTPGLCPSPGSASFEVRVLFV